MEDVGYKDDIFIGEDDIYSENSTYGMREWEPKRESDYIKGIGYIELAESHNNTAAGHGVHYIEGWQDCWQECYNIGKCW